MCVHMCARVHMCAYEQLQLSGTEKLGWTAFRAKVRTSLVASSFIFKATIASFLLFLPLSTLPMYSPYSMFIHIQVLRSNLIHTAPSCHSTKEFVPLQWKVAMFITSLSKMNPKACILCSLI